MCNNEKAKVTYQSLIEKGYTFDRIKHLIKIMNEMPSEKWQRKDDCDNCQRTKTGV